MKTAADELNEYEGFERELHEYLIAYEKHLADNEKLKPATVRKHTNYIHFMISQGYGYHAINGFEDFTLTIIGSKMVRSYNHHNSKALQLSTAYNMSLRFFTFIYNEFGIANQELLHKLRKQK
jgi:hypothetical protein